MNGWVSGSKESYVPDNIELNTKPNVDFADARNWPPIGTKSLSGYQKKRLFHNENGHIFKDDAARQGLDSVKDGRGIAVADFDNDGRLDMFVTNADDEPFLYRNILPTGAHWIGFVLEGTKSNRAGTGTQIRLKAGAQTYLRYSNGGNGFASQSTARIHFGLGKATKIESIEMRWPSGLKQTVPALPVDHWYKLVEGKPTNNLQPWEPKR
jgi:enediyne biosynthesis protein E4